jgi:hypothetical protein
MLSKLTYSVISYKSEGVIFKSIYSYIICIDLKLVDLGKPHLQRRPSPLYLKHHQQSSPRQVISKKIYQRQVYLELSCSFPKIKMKFLLQNNEN